MSLGIRSEGDRDCPTRALGVSPTLCAGRDDVRVTGECRQARPRHCGAALPPLFKPVNHKSLTHMHLQATSAGASPGLGAGGKSLHCRGSWVAGFHGRFGPLLEGLRPWSPTKLGGLHALAGWFDPFWRVTARRRVRLSQAGQLSARHCRRMPLPRWCVSRLPGLATLVGRET